MPLRAFVCAAILAGCAFSQCEPTGNIKQLLDADSKLPADSKTERLASLEKALESNPTNYFLLDRLRRILDEDSTREALLDRLAALRDKYPDSPAVAAVYADELQRRTPRKRSRSSSRWRRRVRNSLSATSSSSPYLNMENCGTRPGWPRRSTPI